MFRSLSQKLILAFLAVTLTSIILFAFFAVRATRRQFNRFVVTSEQAALAEALANYYAETGSWEGLPPFILAVVGGPGQGRFGGPRRVPLLLTDGAGNVIIPDMGYDVGETVSPSAQLQGLPIEVNGEQVGTLYTNFEPVVPRGSEVVFLRGVTQALILSAAFASLIALLLGILLARTLTQQLRELTSATRALARGDLTQQVPVRSEDELGQLAGAFNQMSRDLARALHQRQQMTADIAHDLRTPLSIILGYTESLADGVLPAEQETLSIIHDEARQLNRLVEDLRTLSLADAGELRLQRQPVPPLALLEQAAAAHRARARAQDVTLEVESAPDLPAVDADPDRLDQVLNNLLTNALQHTPAGGTIHLRALPNGAAVNLIVQDSGTGIPPEQLPYIFDRFYSGDPARHTAESSGLGLAIARSIVRLHGGEIGVQSRPGTGTTFTISLPAAHSK